MVSRKLIAALVGLSLATGVGGAASAQPVPSSGVPAAQAAAAPAKPIAATHHRVRMSKAARPRHVGANVGRTGKLAAKSAPRHVHLSNAGRRATKHV